MSINGDFVSDENVKAVWRALLMPGSRQDVMARTAIPSAVVARALRRLRSHRAIAAMGARLRKGGTIWARRCDALPDSCTRKLVCLNTETPARMESAVQRVASTVRANELARGTCRWLVRDGRVQT